MLATDEAYQSLSSAKLSRVFDGAVEHHAYEYVFQPFVTIIFVVAAFTEQMAVLRRLIGKDLNVKSGIRLISRYARQKEACCSVRWLVRLWSSAVHPTPMCPLFHRI